jgi:galactokinase
LHLVDPGAARDVATRVAAAFEKRFGRRPAIVRVETARGAERLDL